MNKQLEILVVEDNPRHLSEAKAEMDRRVARAKESDNVLRVDYATNLAEARLAVAKNNYNGIISDVFYPSGETHSNEEEIKLRKEISEILVHKKISKCGDLTNYSEKYRKEIRDSLSYAINGLRSQNWITELDQLAPFGVMLHKETRDLPFVFCTDMYHHKHEVQPVHEYVQSSCCDEFIWLIDAGSSHEEQRDHKHWNTAFLHLLRFIVARRNNVLAIDAYGSKKNICVPKENGPLVRELEIYPYILEDEKREFNLER